MEKQKKLIEVTRRVKDAFSTEGNVFMKLESFMVKDERDNPDDDFKHGRDQKYHYFTMEMLPCGDQFRNKYHMQYDQTKDWAVPTRDIYYMTRKHLVPKKKKPEEKQKDIFKLPKVKSKSEIFREMLQKRRMSDRRESMNPRGIYERPPGNPDPKGLYNGFGRPSTFVWHDPLDESNEEDKPYSNLEPGVTPEERGSIKRRVKDPLKAAGTSIFMKVTDRPREEDEDDEDPERIPYVPPPDDLDADGNPKKKYKPWKRRVKDRLRGAGGSRKSIFMKLEHVEEDEVVANTFPIPMVEEEEPQPKKKKKNYQKYAICQRRHELIRCPCLACEKEECYKLFTKSLKAEPWKLPRGPPDPIELVPVTASDPLKIPDTITSPRPQSPPVFYDDPECALTFRPKGVTRRAKQKEEMFKKLSTTLRNLNCKC